MTHTDPDMQARIQERLLQHGWVTSRGSAVALKTYHTAVGPKEALAYLYAWEGGRYVLTGDYLSEGRNILEPVLVMITDRMPSERFDDAVRLFSSAVDAVVSHSYAMRLMRAPGEHP